MKERSAQDCINNILRNIEKRRNMRPQDYADRNAVRRYNAAMDRIIENVDYLDAHYPEAIDLLADLANSQDCKIGVTCAHMLHRVKNGTIKHKQIALAAAKQLMNHPDIDPVTQFGMGLNIKRWEAELESMQV